MPDAVLIPSHVNAPGGREPDPEAFVAEIQRRFPDRQSKLILGCRSGVRSKSAASWLVELGYSSILDLEGGWLLWSSNPELPAWGERGEPPAPSSDNNKIKEGISQAVKEVPHAVDAPLNYTSLYPEEVFAQMQNNG